MDELWEANQLSVDHISTIILLTANSLTYLPVNRHSLT